MNSINRNPDLKKILGEEEIELIQNYHKLNIKGKDFLLEYSRMMTQSTKFCNILHLVENMGATEK